MHSSSRRSAQCTRACRAAARRSLAPLALLLAACGSAAPVLDMATPEVVEFARQDVRVRLIFGEEADLDLVVTDPNHEEIYFANTQSRLGGIFDVDRRCGDPAPRVETVSFSPAPAGSYRVSVDFMTRCGRGTDEVPYRLVVEANGETREIAQVARFGELTHVAYEFRARAADPGATEWSEGGEEGE